MEERFDYIIVGAGSSGCVVANRLSSAPGNSVLLIESGPPDKSFLFRMPRGLAKLISPGSPYVSVYEVSKGRGFGSEAWLKGRTLGGSSSINGMIYVRGLPQDYDGWEASGCIGWGWEQMRRCFDEIENPATGANPDGPLHISIHPSGDELCDAVIAAAQQAGTPRAADINALAGQDGIGYQTLNTWQGRRQSSATAFLKPVMDRPNLTVWTDMTALKVVIEDGRAAAVAVVDKNGRRSQVRASKEVILAAGAIETPKLLHLSGIGDGAVLRGQGIPVVRDAPEVGKNLQEHFFLQIQYRVTRGSLNASFSGMGLLKSVAGYMISHSGPMTHGAHEVMGLVKTAPDASAPDATLGVGLYSMSFTDKGLIMDPYPGITLGIYQMRPQSRGALNVVSADPAVAPVIEPNYLVDETDRAAAVNMVRFVRKVAAQPALKPFIIAETSPGPAIESDEDVERYFGENGVRGYHVCGTCRMGGDQDSVVDLELRVRGVSGLRVVDTSIFPAIVSTNTNATAMAVAWRAGELILNSASRQAEKSSPEAVKTHA